MEDALLARLGDGETNKGDGRSSHQGADGKVPVRTDGADVDVGWAAIAHVG